MEVSSLKVAKVFSGGGEVHYILPHFQREYAWDKTNWQTLLDDAFDIYEIYDKNNEPEHFMGALVIISDGTRSGTVPAFKLVDGQQRLTTLSLLLCALARIVESTHPQLHRKIRKLLVNQDEQGELHYKLVPTSKYGDRETYMAIIDGEDVLKDTESKIAPAFEYIIRQLRGEIASGDLDPEQLFLVIANCMHVVFITLDQRERPYEIFESLNAKGKPLTQPDLIRNYIAMKLPESWQAHVFDNDWSNIEQILKESRTVSRIGELTAFLRHYMAHHTGALANKDHVYARFRDRMEGQFTTHEAFAKEIQTLHRFAHYYNRFLRPNNEPDPEIRYRLERLNVFESATAYPFLLLAYEHLEQGRISRDSFIEGLDAIENYLMRRYLAGEPTNYQNKMFPQLGKDINLKDFGQSLRQALLRRNYPSDSRIRQILPSLPLYDTRKPERLILLLETINKYLSYGSGGHTVLDASPTIEHIMPQSVATNTEWKQMLGNGWEEMHRDHLHTIGNLTLVTQEWNSSLSNSPFRIKKQRISTHALLLNSQYFSTSSDEWNVEAIQNRANWITNLSLQIWQAFGEPPASQNMAGRKPSVLVVLEQRYEVKSWRDIALAMAECFAMLADDFDSIASSMPAYFSRHERNRTRQLNNGWWLNIDLSSSNVMQFCDRLAVALNLSSEDWEIILGQDE